MRTQLKRLVAVASALAVATVGLAISNGTASALPPGSPADGPVTIAPLTGNSASTFGMTPPAGASCQGAAAAGYRWQTFMTPISIDAGTLTWNADGPVPQGAEFTAPLYVSGTPIIQQNPAVTPAGLLTPIPVAFDWSAYDTTFRPPAGSYTVGFACSQAGQTTRYWSNVITITDNAAGGPAGFNWQVGLPASAPGAPTGVTVTPASGSLQVAFGAVTANPAVIDYTVTATPSVGAPVSVTGVASPITLTGLTNGTAYQVTVTARNTVGSGPASAPVSGTPTAGAQPPVTNLTAVPGAAAGSILVSWTAPSGVAPTGYTLTVAPAVGGSPFTLPNSPTSFTVPGLPAGVVHTFTVVATYADPSAVATPASVNAAAASAQTLQQEIRVERPAGALILTQRCGVNNALPAEPVDAGFPGFPAVPVLAATTDQIGTSPDIDLGTPGAQVDPEFANYPFPSPATYPTKCVIDLGTARLLTTGDLAGQYYAASGALNEVTVVDTRQGDPGWTINGSISSLSNGSDSFSGDLIGWSPVVSSTSDPVAAGQYDQIVTAGTPVVPGTTGGLSAPAGQVLARANAGAGQGVAVLDARVKVLIPVAKANGFYLGTLNLNAA